MPQLFMDMRITCDGETLVRDSYVLHELHLYKQTEIAGHISKLTSGYQQGIVSDRDVPVGNRKLVGWLWAPVWEDADPALVTREECNEAIQISQAVAQGEIVAS